MNLVLRQVQLQDVVNNEAYLLLKKYEGYDQWIAAVASPRGWVFDTGPNEDREWATMIFQSPEHGVMVDD